jgi:superfamily II DNA or RNA helicase
MIINSSNQSAAGKKSKKKNKKSPSGFSNIFTPLSENIEEEEAFEDEEQIDEYLKDKMRIANRYEGMLEQSKIKDAVRDPLCIRKYSNFSFPFNNKIYNLVDYYPDSHTMEELNDANANVEDLKNKILEQTYGHMTQSYSPENLEIVSPKLKLLIEKIRELDEKDMQVHGKLFKHFIFSDNKSSMSGVKVVASGLIANGFNIGYSAEPKMVRPKKKNKKSKSDSKEKTPDNVFENIVLKSDRELRETPYLNFYMLSSKTVYGKPIPVTTRKEMLRRFNSRPDNIGGELSRIIIMDGGFKEGIDLFDIKYVHIFEPTITKSDQTQVIGRGTRTCGQKGLDFHPTRGWPLYVYVYDLNLREYPEYFSETEDTGIKLLLQSMGVNLQLLNFYTELEGLAIESAVDHQLNRKIHSFKSSGSSSSNIAGARKKKMESIKNTTEKDINPRKMILPNTWLTGSRPNGELTYVEMDNYVNKYLSDYSWEDLVMKNNCVNPADLTEPPNIPRSSPVIPSSESVMRGGMMSYTDAYDQKILTVDTIGAQGMSGGAGGEIINFTPTQGFVSNFFTPMLPLKGMLLWHSVGTGKTCSAIATASSFEQEGYTILWVTRTTLKNDIWKNMFDQVCSLSIQDKIRNGLVMPSDMSARKRLLPKEWKIQPMSYKQFSNLVSKKNNIYEDMVKRNGPVDPLRKTLIVIDEAHKLYGGGDLSSLEQPDMVSFHKAVMDSYAKSGLDSVRLLLMTATPIQKDPMELIKILNLTKLPNDQLPDTFESFSERFLNEEGKFTQHGINDFMDEVAGHISYLNREKDARQFSQPVIKQVKVPIMPRRVQQLVKRGIQKKFKHFSKSIKNDINKKNNDINETKKDIDKINLVENHFVKQTCDKAYKGKFKTACRKRIKTLSKKIKEEIKNKVDDLKQSIKNDKDQLKYVEEQKKEDLKNALENVESGKIEYLKTLRNGKIMIPSGVLQKLAYKCTSYKSNDKELVKYLSEHSPELAIMEQDLDAATRDLTNIKNRYSKEKNKDIKKELKQEIDDLEERKKKTEKDRSELLGKIKSGFSKQTKKAKDNLKKAKSTTKKAIKLIHKQNEYENAIKEVDENVEKFTEELSNYYNEVETDVKEKELEEEEKKIVKQEKAAEKERARQEKAAEKERARQEKARVKTEKARAKAEAAAAKKTRKNRN